MKDNNVSQNPLVRVYLLGQCRLERRRGATWEVVNDAAWQQRRVRSLLCCLLSHASRILGREQVMEALWPEIDMTTSANRLNTAVHGLRQILEPELERPANSQMLRLEHDVFVLAPQNLVWVDVDAFDELLHQSYIVEDAWDSECLLTQAVRLYQGEFFPEERVASWVVARRNVLQRKWVGMLLSLVDLYSARSAFSDAIGVLERLLAVDPAHEAAVRHLMLALSQLGRRTEALRVYQQLVTMLQKLYGAEPLLETQQLYVSLVKKTRPLPSLSTHAKFPVSLSPNLSSAHHAFPFSAPLVGDSPHPHRQPMIGREQEYAAMCHVIRAIQGDVEWQQEPIPHLLLLAGEIGIGKTHLIEVLSSFARKQGWIVAWISLSKQEQPPPYRAWVDVFRQLRAHGHRSEQEETEYAYLLRLLSGQPIGLHTNITAHISDLPYLREAAFRYLALISARAPLLIVFDDIHWLDSSSIKWLTSIVRRISQKRIVFVGTCLNSELFQGHSLRSLISDLCREQAAFMYHLQPLSDKQIMQMLAPLPLPLARYISKLASGNPFFAKELAHALSTISFGEDVLEPLILPPSITTAFESLLAPLSQGCHGLLRKVARIGGTSFELRQLLMLDTGYSEDEMLDLLDEALHAGLLCEEGMGRTIRYNFSHPLLAYYLYSSSPAADRTFVFHQGVNTTCESHSEQGEHIAFMARDLFNAGDLLSW